MKEFRSISAQKSLQSMYLKDDPVRFVKTRIGKSIIVSTFCLCLAITLWFTPLPNAPEISCDRPCHELEWPRICRLEFLLESYRRPRSGNCQEEGHCDGGTIDLHPEGEEFLVLNQQISASTIHVCVHDILLINVVNQIPDRAVSIHWRGQTMSKQPWMDGVSMISQCPINSFTTFQYKFRAADVGTHSWYLHTGRTGAPSNNFINGLLVVRESTRQDPHRSLIDHDFSEHRVLLTTISKKDETTILINGKYSHEYSVHRGKRFRFRVAHFGGNAEAGCALRGSIEKHTLVVLAVDGNSIEAVNTTSFTIVEGERLDFVVTADQTPGVYDMKFRFVNCPITWSSAAKFIYSEDGSEKKYTSTGLELPLSQPFSTVMTEDCGKSTLCLENVASISSKQNTALEGFAEKVLFLTYGYRELKVSHIAGVFEIPQINNFTFLYPTSPLNSQIEDISTSNWCGGDEKPIFCSNSEICRCTHVIEVDVGAVIDVVLIHEEKRLGREHIFHLHGHKFHVLGRQTSENKLNVKSKQELLYHRKTVMKDTVSVPRNGSAVFRFLADNIGYWLLEEESVGPRGMQLVFHVRGDAYTVPEKFPKCGNWVGPKYFMA